MVVVVVVVVIVVVGSGGVVVMVSLVLLVQRPYPRLYSHPTPSDLSKSQCVYVPINQFPAPHLYVCMYVCMCISTLQMQAGVAP